MSAFHAKALIPGCLSSNDGEDFVYLSALDHTTLSNGFTDNRGAGVATTEATV